MCLGTYLVEGVGGDFWGTVFPAWGWWWLGLSKKNGGVYFFAILGVVGGVNYPRHVGSNIRP